MKFRASDWDFICTKLQKDGRYEMMVYNPAKKELYLEKVGEEHVNGTDSYGNPYTAAVVSRATFDAIFDKFFRNGGCSGGFFSIWDDKEFTYNPDKGESVDEDTVIRAIKGELTQDELNKVLQMKPKAANYYDYDSFISVIQRFKRGEISGRYFIDWTIVVAWALGANTFRENSPREVLYAQMSECFDGFSFLDYDEEKERECNDLLARVKYFDHRLKNIAKREMPPFYTDDSVAVYVLFDYCNHRNEHCKVCVADEENEVFRITYAANLFYLENVNYNFIDEDEFSNLSSEYYEFYHDKNLDISKYIVELPYYDSNGKIIDGTPKK